MADTVVISLGGSIVAPAQVDTDFLRVFRSLISDHLRPEGQTRFILVVGGGGPARAWQQAYRTVADSPSDSEADWIGIAATRLNARLVKAVFSEFCTDEVATDPTAAFGFTGRVLVAAGWKPGFSTDYDAVLLAERFGAKLLINLSNIEKVFTDDPKKNPAAKPIEDITWQEFQNIVGTEWVPGKNSPFDPVATDRARKLGLTVIVAAGKDTENLARILNGGPFTGTTIHP